MIVELEFLCGACGFPVADDAGSVYMRFPDLHAHQRQMEDWRRIYGDGSGGLSLDEVFAHPANVSWLIHHYACEPDEAASYQIGVEQVRTWRQLVEWTSHLMEKNWLAETNWAALLGSAARGTDPQIKGVRVRGDAA